MTCRRVVRSGSSASRTPGRSVGPTLGLSYVRDRLRARHHLDEVAVAQLIGDVPSDAENDDCAIKVATLKEG
jgi:hypothetical protein